MYNKLLPIGKGKSSTNPISKQGIAKKYVQVTEQIQLDKL